MNARAALGSVESCHRNLSLYLEGTPDRESRRLGPFLSDSQRPYFLSLATSFLRKHLSTEFLKPTMGVRSFVKHSALLALTVGSSHGIRIIQSNDDGWAELNIREFHDMLIDAGHDAVVSAPAENMSGKGTLQTPITLYRRLLRLIARC